MIWFVLFFIFAGYIFWNIGGGVKVPVAENKKDLFAKIGFILGLFSIPFAFIGVVPLLAIIFSSIAFDRTRQVGTGRWMAITGLILGIVYFLANMHINGYLF